MCKTKIKRYEFSTTVILLVLFATAAGLMLLSAYGAVCVTWDTSYWAREMLLPMPPPGRGFYMFPYMATFGNVMQVFWILTWIMAFFWGFVIYSFLTNRKWAYVSALAAAGIGFVVGLIPALIADTNGFTMTETISNVGPPTPVWEVVAIEFEIGSPHWAKTFANLLVLIVILPYPKSPIKRSIDSFVATDNKWGGTVARQLTFMSAFFFWLAFLSFLGSGFLADAHVINGVNVWQMVQMQTIGGIVTTITGSSMLAGGLILRQIKRPHSLTGTL
ncbi:MAG: hypothetical protein ACW96X_10980 [Promethearchaeota archaeon]